MILRWFMTETFYKVHVVLLLYLIWPINATKNSEINPENHKLVCQDQILDISCPNHRLIKIVRAYYGRYSLSRCNENFEDFQVNCAANNTVDKLQFFCEDINACELLVNNAKFGNPCPGSIHILEVFYNCIDDPTTKHTTQTVQTTVSLTTYTSSKYLTTNQRTQPTATILNTREKLLTTTNQATTNGPTTYMQQTERMASVQTDFTTIRQKQFCKFDDSMTKFRIGDLIEKTCSAYETGKRFYRCDKDGNFVLISSNCLQIFQLNEIMTNGTTSEDELERFNTMLKDDVNQTLLNSNNIKNVVRYFRDVTNRIMLNPQLDTSSNIILNTANTLLSKTKTWSTLEVDERSSIATALLDTIENVLFHINTKSKIQFNTLHIVAERRFNREVKSNLRFPTMQTSMLDSVQINFKDPSMEQKFLFIAYTNINDFLLNNQIMDKPSQAQKLVNTNILAFKMDSPITSNNLSIELTFVHSNADLAQNPVCSYWSYNESTFENGKWLSDGCSLKSTNHTHTVCICDHLTHFAVLMDVHGAHEHVNTIHDRILTIITVALSFISMLSIVATLLVFRFMKIIRKTRDRSSAKDLTKITTHLCFCLLMSLLVFLSGILVKYLKLKLACSIIAVLSHYFFLCSFFWMFLEGVQLYLMLVRIFVLEVSPLLIFYLIAYFIPFVIVLTSVLINYLKLDSRGYGTASFCWLSSFQHFNLTFIGPVTFILIANLVILLVVLCEMRIAVTSRKMNLHRNKKHDSFYRSLLGFWCFILTILGLPWILGYLIINDERTIVFSYLFTIINSSQGTLIFIFNCLMSKNVRKELHRMLFKYRRTSSSHASKAIVNKTITSFSTSSAHKPSNYSLSKLSNRTDGRQTSVFKSLWEKLICGDDRRSDEPSETSKRMTKSLSLINNNNGPHRMQAYLTGESERLVAYENNGLKHTNSIRPSRSLNFESRITELTSTASSNTSSPPPYTYYLQPKTPYSHIGSLVRSATQQMASFKPFPSQTTSTTMSNYANQHIFDKNLVAEDHNYSLINNDDVQSNYCYADHHVNNNNYVEMQNNYYDEVDEQSVTDTTSATTIGTRSYLLKELTKYQIRFAEPEVYEDSLGEYTINHSLTKTSSYSANSKFKTIFSHRASNLN